MKIQRAKAYVDAAGSKVLTECESCGKKKYIVEGQTVCEECKSKRRKQKISTGRIWTGATPPAPG